jgi:hypothetical protein
MKTIGAGNTRIGIRRNIIFAVATIYWTTTMLNIIVDTVKCAYEQLEVRNGISADVYR